MWVCVPLYWEATADSSPTKQSVCPVVIFYTVSRTECNTTQEWNHLEHLSLSLPLQDKVMITEQNHVTFSLITLDCTKNTGNCTVLHVDLHTDNTFLGLLIMNTFWLYSLFLLHSPWQETGGINGLLNPFNWTYTIIVLATVIYNISRKLNDHPKIENIISLYRNVSFSTI
jgi:hypothetical protein